MAADLRRSEKESRRRARPSAIRHASVADAHWNCPERREFSGEGKRPRGTSVRSDAARHADRRVARAGQRSGVRGAGRCCGLNHDSDRSGQRRGRSACHRISLREAVQDGKTAALVTPDRVLARRVAAALMRWNIAVEDTGGDPLAETSAGIFARLAAQAAVAGLEPVTLLALLKHPLLRLGKSDHRYATDILERAVLRGPRPNRGTAGLARALKTL